MISESTRLYASVDLELTGFDPQTEEIIEIGIVVFKVTDGILVQTDRFESLVRPQKSHVRSRITGLTGIAQTDLESAPTWQEIAEKVSILLAGTVLVGHGVDLDTRFLRAVGVDAFVGVIDTLELSQIFLPTYHSYNLESLGHLFSVAHEGVHRAGGDAEATIGVLQGLMGVYRSLSDQTQRQLCTLGELSGQSWPVLFQSILVSPQLPAVKRPVVFGALQYGTDVPTRSHILALGLGSTPPIGSQLAARVPAWSVAFLDREQAFQYAQAYPEAEPYVGAFEYLSQSRLEDLLEQSQSLTAKEQIGVMKILVWKEQFSQFGILSEINWSIIGTEIKKRFTQGFAARTPDGLIAADFRSVPDVGSRRPLWVYRLEDLFEWLSQKSGYVVSWQSFVSALKQVYNPESNIGQTAVAGEVESLIAAADAYFASALLLVRSTIYRAAGSASREELEGYTWSRLAAGAESLVAKVESSTIYGQNTFLQKQSVFLKRFFQEEAHNAAVGWLEFSDKNVSYFNKPIQYSDAHQQFISQASPVVYQTSITDESVLSYIRSRIGLTEIPTQQAAKPLQTDHQVRLKKGKHAYEVLNQILREESESTLVLFTNVDMLRGYYDVNYTALLTEVPVLAIGIHGGAHKILRNFNRSHRSVVLASVTALQTYVGEQPEFARIVYVCSETDGVSYHHPYISAIAQHMHVAVSVLQRIQDKIELIRVLNALSLQRVNELIVIESSRSTLGDGESMKSFVQEQLSTAAT